MSKSDKSKGGPDGQAAEQGDKSKDGPDGQAAEQGDKSKDGPDGQAAEQGGAPEREQPKPGRAATLARTAEKPDAKKPVHPGEERVEIVLHRGPMDAKKTHQAVAVNTERVLIPFEIPCRVKRKFLGVLQDAIIDHLVVTDENREMIQEINPERRFGVSVTG